LRPVRPDKFILSTLRAKAKPFLQARGPWGFDGLSSFRSTH
jgi:hypothetical protein